MPDPLDFDGARRALDDVPAPDLWADASQRAEAGAVVPLPAASGERARRPRWLVAVGVAAVAVLAVGTAAALLADDDQSVDTTPTTEPPAGHRRSHDRHRRRLHGRHHRRPHRDGRRSRRGSAALRSLRSARQPARRPHDARVAGGRAPRARRGADGPRRRAGGGRRARAGHRQHLVRPRLRAGALVPRRAGAVRVVHRDGVGRQRGRQPPRRRRPSPSASCCPSDLGEVGRRVRPRRHASGSSSAPTVVANRPRATGCVFTFADGEVDLDRRLQQLRGHVHAARRRRRSTSG